VLAAQQALNHRACATGRRAGANTMPGWKRHEPVSMPPRDHSGGYREGREPMSEKSAVTATWREDHTSDYQALVLMETRAHDWKFWIALFLMLAAMVIT